MKFAADSEEGDGNGMNAVCSDEMGNYNFVGKTNESA